MRREATLALALALVPAPAMAEDLRAVALEKGQRAPFSGQLLTPDLAIDLGLRAERGDARLRLALTATAAAWKARYAALEQRHEIETRALEGKLELTEKAWEEDVESLKPRWYEHPAFIAGSTVAGVVLLLLAGREILRANP